MRVVPIPKKPRRKAYFWALQIGFYPGLEQNQQVRQQICGNTDSPGLVPAHVFVLTHLNEK